jgi:hypothetical protein
MEALNIEFRGVLTTLAPLRFRRNWAKIIFDRFSSAYRQMRCPVVFKGITKSFPNIVTKVGLI